MTSKLVSAGAITTIYKNGRQIAVEFVERTDVWVCPTGYPTDAVKQSFTKVVEENIASIRPEVTKVAMKESEHQSDRDLRMHYSSYMRNDKSEDLGTKHFVHKKKETTKK